MTDDDESYKTDGGHPSWGVNPRIGKTPDAESNEIAEETYQNARKLQGTTYKIPINPPSAWTRFKYWLKGKMS